MPSRPFPRLMPRRTRISRRAGCASRWRPRPRPGSTRWRPGWSQAIRAKTGGLGGIEDFLHAYSLSTREGLALMVLAEALAARARCRHRQPPDRGQACGRGLVAARRRLAADLRLGLDARRDGAADRAGRDAGIDPASTCQADRAARDPHRRAAGDAAPRLAFRARPDHRRGARPRERSERMALLLRHAGRGRAHARRRGALFQVLRQCDREHRTSAPAIPPCRSAREFPSSSRRCIRATRRRRANA